MFARTMLCTHIGKYVSIPSLSGFITIIYLCLLSLLASDKLVRSLPITETMPQSKVQVLLTPKSFSATYTLLVFGLTAMKSGYSPTVTFPTTLSSLPSITDILPESVFIAYTLLAFGLMIYKAAILSLESTFTLFFDDRNIFHSNWKNGLLL